MSINFAILLMVVLIVAQFIDNLHLRGKISKMKEQVDDAISSAKSAKEAAVKAKENIMAITIGDKVIFDYGLSYKSSNTSFNVKYEAEILEVSDTSVKVKAYDFTLNGSAPAELTSQANWEKSVTNYMDGIWIKRSEISIIRDKNDIREHKIDEVLSQ